MTTLTLVADENILGLEALIEEIPDFTIKLITRPGREINAQDLVDADVLFVRSVTSVNEALLKNSTVQFVGTATAGLEHVDTDYLKKQNIHFCSAQGANANAVAEYVLAAMAYISREKERNFFNKTIGIVGHGHVGKALERKLRSLGCEIKLYDPLLQEQQQQGLPLSKNIYSEWSELLQCDVISFHVPLVKGGMFPTLDMMNQAFFDAISDDCLLINAARGEICDEEALLGKINNSGISTVWDVWNNEPNINQQLLAQVDLATPHIAGYSLDAKINASKALLKALCDFMSIRSALDESAAPVIKKENKVDIENKQLFDIMLYPYNPGNDSCRLKDVGEHGLPAYFDELRKNYQHRLEWCHYHVTATQAPAEVMHSLHGLGFYLE